MEKTAAPVLLVAISLLLLMFTVQYGVEQGEPGEVMFTGQML